MFTSSFLVQMVLPQRTARTLLVAKHPILKLVSEK